MKKLGFGFMRLPLLDQDDVTSIDYARLNEMVDTYLAAGFTYFDTAYVYHGGASEVAIGQALAKRHARETFQLASKMSVAYIPNKEEQPGIFETQLQRCGVDYFDNYLVHNMGALTYKKAEEFGTFALVQQWKKEGRIKRIGFSFHDNANLLNQILTEHPEVDFVQLQINYLDWENDSIQSRKCYEVARKHGKPVIVMEPLKGGALARVPVKAQELFKGHRPELSVSSWALRFAASLEGVEVVLSGMSDMQQMLDNTGYMRRFQPLDQQEYSILEQAKSSIDESIAIPCTACQYCVETCPKNIAIPKYFALYNNDKLTPAVFSIPQVYYNNYTALYGKASDCVGCKLCEQHCPQQLAVVKYLKEVALHFEGCTVP